MTCSTDNDNGSDDATADSNWHGPTITRRAAIAAVGSILGLSSSDSVSAQQTSGGSSVAITSATQVAGTQLYIGPDSAKSNVKQEAGRVYQATDTQVMYYSDGANWVKLGVGSVQESVPQVNTETATINDTVSGGKAAPMRRATWSAEFEQKLNLDGGWNNPVLLDEVHFADENYRIISEDQQAGEYRVHTTADFTSFSFQISDLFPSFSQGLCDGIVLDDGRFLFLFNNGNQGMDVLTAGSSSFGSGNFTNRGEATSGTVDGGAYQDDSGTVHYYGEDFTGTVSSKIIEHHTAPASNLINSTQQPDALNLSDAGWSTGDPSFERVGEFVYMFHDFKVNHPNYHTAVSITRKDNLDSFSVVNHNINPSRFGGDIDVVKRGNIWEAVTELDEGNTGDMGHWKMTPVPWSGGGIDGRRYQMTDTNTGADISRSQFDDVDDEWNFDLLGAPQYPKPKFRLFNNSGDLTGALRSSNTGSLSIDGPTDGVEVGVPGSGQVEFSVENSELKLLETGAVSANSRGLFLQANNGEELNLGVTGSGSVEVNITENRTDINQFISLNIKSSPPSSPVAGDVYIDDGTNTASGNLALRVYDGTSFIDMN
jgi:hypothetical protein